MKHLQETMKARLYIVFFCNLMLFAMAQGTPACNTQLQLSVFLNDSYPANANLIRFGVPSDVVRVYYNDALKDLALNCNCGPMLLDEPCVNTKFNSDWEVSALRSIVDGDDGVTNASKLFRLYDSQKTLNNLRMDQETKLNLGLELLNKHTQDLNLIPSLGWHPAQFPSDDSFFEDDNFTRKAACSLYDSGTHVDDIRYPASAATAYVLGLVQSVRRVDGNLTVAHEMLANHTEFVFNGVRCYKLSGDKLMIPITYMQQYKNTTKMLLMSAGQNSSEYVNDVRTTAGNAKFFLYPLVKKFSSLISYGDSETVLYTRNESPGGDLVERKSVSEVMQNDHSLALNSSLITGIGSVISGITNNMGGLTCPPGWIFVSRAVSLMSADEECCSDKCEMLALSLNDPFLWSIEQENCCANCNLFVCQDQSLLPDSIPLTEAPPTEYPTNIDL
eukprot:TRINITY_DN10242_c0_g1_i1.p1 TRINITY_DN10242_c0_g1~~TRINITY_DN10242_c0_g1_i1.p1  ORF type:complete len:446 (-),score=47.75 TRINITY_DN10242_c0_g1_i1:506-1843(-)